MWWKVGVSIVIVGILGWVGWIVTRPIPGTKIADQGREHVAPQAVADFNYNSNPPTSGPHLPMWVRAGVFTTPQSEGELIHALEHGYIIISYNCNVHLRSSVIPGLTRNPSFLKIGSGLPSLRWGRLGRDDIIGRVFAHEEEGSSPSAEFKDPTISTGSATNDTDRCKTLVKNLSELANKKKLWKLAVVPRPSLTTTIALTAWNYLDTFDQFDAGRIERFIDYHRDQGPEKTME